MLRKSKNMMKEESIAGKWILTIDKLRADHTKMIFVKIDDIVEVTFFDNQISSMTIACTSLRSCTIVHVYTIEESGKEKTVLHDKLLSDFKARSLSELLVKLDLEGYLFDEPAI